MSIYRDLYLTAKKLVESKDPTINEFNALLQELASRVAFCHNSFPITSLAKSEVANLLKLKDGDARLTDEFMVELASKMASDYTEQLYWSSLQIIAEDLLPENRSTERRVPSHK